jgi:hypothetical protein
LRRRAGRFVTIKKNSLSVPIIPLAEVQLAHPALAWVDFAGPGLVSLRSSSATILLPTRGPLRQQSSAGR